MASNPANNTEQQVDLSLLFKKIGGAFDHLGFSIFKFLKFLQKNIIILLILLVGGAVAGYFLDEWRGDRYRHEVIVVPNFNSVDYLYKKVEDLNLKDNPIRKVEVKPIDNVNDFIKEAYNNLEIAKYYSENNIKFTGYSDIDSKIQQFYRYHQLTIYTKGKDEDNVLLNSFLDSLNMNPALLERQKIEQANTSKFIKELEHSIADVNRILEKFGDTSTSKLGEINVETYNNLNDLVNTKRNITNELGRMKISEKEQEKPIYDYARNTNIKDNKFKLSIVLPILLLLGFFGLITFRNFMRRYSVREA